MSRYLGTYCKEGIFIWTKPLLSVAVISPHADQCSCSSSTQFKLRHLRLKQPQNTSYGEANFIVVKILSMKDLFFFSLIV